MTVFYSIMTFQAKNSPFGRFFCNNDVKMAIHSYFYNNVSKIAT